MKTIVNGKYEKVSDFSGGHAGVGHAMGGGFRSSAPRTIAPARPAGGLSPRMGGGHHGGGGHRGGTHPVGMKRPFWGVGGGWLIWNGYYWIDPLGVCYYEDALGNYVAANCVVANSPIDKLQPDVLLFSGADGEKSPVIEYSPSLAAVPETPSNNKNNPFKITPSNVSVIAYLAVLVIGVYLLNKNK